MHQRLGRDHAQINQRAFCDVLQPISRQIGLDRVLTLCIEEGDGLGIATPALVKGDAQIGDIALTLNACQIAVFPKVVVLPSVVLSVFP